MHLTKPKESVDTVSYTHLRAHETLMNLVCRLLLEKKKRVQTENLKRIKKLQKLKNRY